MRFLKGLLLSLVLIFVTPGGMEPTPPTPTGDKRRRKILAECESCGFTTDTVGGMDGHVCSGHPKVNFDFVFGSNSCCWIIYFYVHKNSNSPIIDWRVLFKCVFLQKFYILFSTKFLYFVFRLDRASKMIIRRYASSIFCFTFKLMFKQ